MVTTRSAAAEDPQRVVSKKAPTSRQDEPSPATWAVPLAVAIGLIALSLTRTDGQWEQSKPQVQNYRTSSPSLEDAYVPSKLQTATTPIRGGPAKIMFAGKALPFPGDDWAGWDLRNRDDRYNAWLSWIQFHGLPAHTSRGFEVATIPAGVHERLRQSLLRYRQNTPRKDDPVNIIETIASKHRHSDNEEHVTPTDGHDKAQVEPPGFIEQPRLNREILAEMRPLVQKWSGLSLVPTAAYGLRVYKRGNVLKRHVDRLVTHVASAILHIDREQDAPWPIVIEDNEGHEHAVDLLPGQMLYYESAKLPHMRPSAFNGTFYSSLFIHYAPTEWNYTDDMLRAALPPGWDRDTTP